VTFAKARFQKSISSVCCPIFRSNSATRLSSVRFRTTKGPFCVLLQFPTPAVELGGVHFPPPAPLPPRSVHPPTAVPLPPSTPSKTSVETSSQFPLSEHLVAQRVLRAGLRNMVRDAAAADCADAGPSVSAGASGSPPSKLVISSLRSPLRHFNLTGGYDVPFLSHLLNVLDTMIDLV